MRGCTISFIRATREEALEDVKARIIEYAEHGLWPDSELVILQEGAKEAELYHVLIADTCEPNSAPKKEIRINRVDCGRAFHVSMAAKFNRAMKPGEWIATIHVHT